MPSWIGLLVISKSKRRNPPFTVQYWRKPSMTPACLGLDSVEDVRRYLRHCRLSDTTPDQVVEQLRTASEVRLSTIESEEMMG